MKNYYKRFTTRGIKHWGLSGYLNFLPRIKFSVTGQESSPKSPTISYRKPLSEIVDFEQNGKNDAKNRKEGL